MESPFWVFPAAIVLSGSVKEGKPASVGHSEHTPSKLGERKHSPPHHGRKGVRIKHRMCFLQKRRGLLRSAQGAQGHLQPVAFPEPQHSPASSSGHHRIHLTRVGSARLGRRPRLPGPGHGPPEPGRHVSTDAGMTSSLTRKRTPAAAETFERELEAESQTGGRRGAATPRSGRAEVLKM